VAGHEVDFVAFHLTCQDRRRLLGHNTLAQLAGHLMHVILIEIEFLGYLVIREIEAHEVQTQNPDPKGLMMPGKNGIG